MHYLIVCLILITLIVMKLILKNHGYGNKTLSTYIDFCIFTILIIFPGLRGDVGSDTHNYRVSYELFADGFFLRYEPLFAAFSLLHYKLIGNSDVYIFTISTIQGLILYAVSKRLPHSEIFLLVYILTFYVELHFNTIRVGLGFLLFLYAILISGKYKSQLLLIMSLLTHFSLLIFLPLYLFVKRKQLSKSKVVFVGISLGFVSFYSGIYESIVSRFHYYSILSNVNILDISRVGLLVSFLYFLSFMLDRKVKLDYFVVTMFFSLIFLISSMIDIAYRIYNLSFLLMFVFYCVTLPQNSTKGNESIFMGGRVSSLIMISVFCFTFIQVAYYSFIGYEITNERGVGFLPYELFWQ